MGTIEPATLGGLDRRSVYRHIRQTSDTTLGKWICQHTRVLISVGDVNSWLARPLRLQEDGGDIPGKDEMVAPIPVAGPHDVLPFGASDPSGTVDAGADVSAMDLPDSHKWRLEWERTDYWERVLQLEYEESVCVVKAPSGLGPARPLRGSLVQRGGDKLPITFEHTLPILYTKDPSEQSLIPALFALLVSSTSNFVFTLHSTNAHVGLAEIKRLPLPNMDDKTLRQLGRLGWKVQEVGEEYWDRKLTFGCDEDLHAIDPSLASVIRESPGATETLEEAVRRDHLSLPIDQKVPVSSLVEEGAVSFQVQGVYQEFVEARLKRVDAGYGDCRADVLLPTPQTAESCQEFYEETRERMMASREKLYETLAELDQYALGLYGIVEPEVIALIGRGMPWAQSGHDWVEGIQKHY